MASARKPPLDVADAADDDISFVPGSGGVVDAVRSALDHGALRKERVTAGGRQVIPERAGHVARLDDRVKSTTQRAEHPTGGGRDLKRRLELAELPLVQELKAPLFVPAPRRGQLEGGELVVCGGNRQRARRAEAGCRTVLGQLLPQLASGRRARSSSSPSARPLTQTRPKLRTKRRGE